MLLTNSCWVEKQEFISLEREGGPGGAGQVFRALVQQGWIRSLDGDRDWEHTVLVVSGAAAEYAGRTWVWF